MERQKYNRLIVKTLSELIEKHSYLRFGQLLVDCDALKYIPDALVDGQRENLLLVDPFYEESEVTLDRILKSRICNEKI